MLVINIVGLLLIALIVWWFWLYKPKSETPGDKGLTVVVENGVYTPSYISLSSGEPHDLTFLRKDASPCAEMVIFPDLDINETLPVNKPTTIHLPATEPGEYKFHCQMQMYKGAINVKSAT